jgi:hypothetical protein
MQCSASWTMHVCCCNNAMLSQLDHWTMHVCCCNNALLSQLDHWTMDVCCCNNAMLSQLDHTRAVAILQCSASWTMHVRRCNNAMHSLKKLTWTEISGFKMKTFQDGHANYRIFFFSFCVMYSPSRFWWGGGALSLLILEPLRICFVIKLMRTSNFYVLRKANDRNMTWTLWIGQISSITLYTCTALWYFRVCTRQCTAWTILTKQVNRISFWTLVFHILSTTKIFYISREFSILFVGCNQLTYAVLFKNKCKFANVLPWDDMVIWLSMAPTGLGGGYASWYIMHLCKLPE